MIPYVTNSYQIVAQTCIDDAIKHAKMGYPFETCGAVIGGQFVPYENRAENKKNSFLINDLGFSAAYRAGQVECVIHSHQDAPHASKPDQEHQQNLEVPFGIINLRQNSVLHVVFWGPGIPREPLKGRQFFFGVWDCFGLVRDFILERFGILAPNPPRDPVFRLKRASVFEQFMSAGQLPFRPVSLDDLQPDDILFYGRNGTRFLNHCAVMREQGLVLHHYYNQVSRQYPVTYERDYLYKAYRFDPDLKIENMPDWERGDIHDN